MQGRTDGAAIAVLLASALALAAATPAAAQTEPLRDQRSHLLDDGRSLLLFPRERVVLSVAPDGALTILSATAADPALALPKPGRADDDAAAAIREADPGAIAVLMGPVGDRGATLLMIASGVSQAFDYRAAAVADPARPEPTPLKVCTVLPLLPSYEQWRTAAPAIMLTGFKFRASNVVLCPDPPRVVDAPKVPSR